MGVAASFCWCLMRTSSGLIPGTRPPLMTSSKTAEYQSADSLETTIGDLVTTVLRLSRELKSGEKDLKQVLTEIPELMVSQGLLEYLLNQGQLDKLQDFLDREDTPPSFAPHSEITWPVPVRLFPCHK